MSGMKPAIYTTVAHDEHDERHHGAVTFPIYQNTLFSFAGYHQPANPYTYSRGTNPTVRELERKLAELEGGEDARCCASGMAAISAAILSRVQAGDHIVCVDQVYTGTRAFLEGWLPRFGVSTTFVNGASLPDLEAATLEHTVLLYLESPTSFFFELQDIAACAALAKRRGLTTILDNSWATPCFQRPLELGVDLVVHSLTKYVGGHSDALGGAVIGSRDNIRRILEKEGVLLGGVMTAHTASLMLRGLRTLPLRMERYRQTGRIVADYLSGLAFINRINYPGLPNHPQHKLAIQQMDGFGSLLSFEWDVPLEQAQAWADALRYYRNGCSWGGYESLVLVIAPLSELGRSEPGILVRLYSGLEEPQALIDDMANAFAAILAGA
ncbi:trans-sulfuration enzyme family protein [Paenibacillus cymbidii]|uniref:trans-sulfuration enzyme family protein n=1 Tax=Paenibacillus cymbidii TaxID=1639034 RepID=UPI001F422BC4|nr:PLP-dependent aspartate aminotransferase family protein [Paenibacillus cymbidii]